MHAVDKSGLPVLADAVRPRWCDGMSSRELLEIYQLANRYSFARFAERVRNPAPYKERAV